MRKVREMLRLRYESGLSFAKIALSCGVGETTVGECINRAKAAGLTWPLSHDLDDETLDGLLYQASGCQTIEPPPMPDFGMVHTELRRKSVTLQLLWQEYKQTHPTGYQYSQFCFHYKEFKKTLEYSFRNSYKGGEKLFVDYAGQTVTIYDPRNGGPREAQIFIAVLGASSYTYAEATWTQELPNWISSHVRAFEFFGGSTSILVPDNLKSAVTRPCRYDPDINPAYFHMASYYRAAVIPARPYRPKDKAKAEAGVLLVERWILAALRRHRFSSLADLNAMIATMLVSLNARRFRKMPGSRRDLFETLDVPELTPLPDQRYEYVNFKLARVNINYHVEVEGHNYSVPYTLVQKQVEIRYGDAVIEVFNKGERVASHPRSYTKAGYTTLSEHMPPSHQKYASWTPERMIRWAGEAGEATAKAASAIIGGKRHPEQGFKAVLGLIRLGDSLGKERLEAACAQALKIGSPRYQTIKNIIALPLKRDDQDTATIERPTPAHGNIRGKAYYN
ncbi:MAG: IS21 family transposase [Proteobacteria bacterium]|nr:IS21 family transposase [Pseudomonadota bacterium]